MLSILGTHKLHTTHTTLTVERIQKKISVFIISKGSIYIQGNNNDTAIFQIGMYKTVHKYFLFSSKRIYEIFHYVSLVFLIQKTNPQLVRQIGTYV